MSVRRGIGRLAWGIHRWIYTRTGGRLGGRIVGMPVLLLTTTGRSSGRPRTVPLTYLPEGQNFVVIASNGGARRDPDWYANLRAHPAAWVQINRRTVRVNVRDAGDDERERLWIRAVKAYGGYAAYRKRTRRRIPVVVLEPET
jgi:deazaflavin-dependent oxidoreductase (nitroreductase family)